MTELAEILVVWGIRREKVNLKFY